jgi:predicted patatin/cPLA2 family phospholipase
MTTPNLEYELQQSQAFSRNLIKKLKEYLSLKESFYKDKKNYQKQQMYFAKETELKNILYPKPSAQLAIKEWEAR